MDASPYGCSVIWFRQSDQNGLAGRDTEEERQIRRRAFTRR